MASNKKRKIEYGEGESGGKDSGRANWSKESIHIFCDLCMERLQRSIGKHGLRMSWKTLEGEFQRRTNLAYTKNQLKAKWDWMKSRWSLWKALKRNEPEFAWDQKKGTISACDEWWQRKTEENVHFKVFQDEGIEPELECKMEKLFGGSGGACDISSMMDSDKFVQNEAETETILRPRPLSVNAANGCEIWEAETIGVDNIQQNESSEDFVRDYNPSSPPTLKSPQNNTHNGKEDQRNSDIDTSENNINAHIDSSRIAAMVMENLSSMIQTIVDRKRRQVNLDEPAPSLSESLEKIISMPGLTHGSTLFSFACSLMEDPKKRIILHGIPDDYSRLEWIKFLCEERKGCGTLVI